MILLMVQLICSPTTVDVSLAYPAYIPNINSNLHQALSHKLTFNTIGFTNIEPGEIITGLVLYGKVYSLTYIPLSFTHIEMEVR